MKVGKYILRSLIFGLFVFLFISVKTTQAAVDCTATGVTGVPQIECEALMALYNSANGLSWTNKANWDTATAVSTWYGITVASGHVTSVQLISNNLSGTLPTEIGNLTSLTTLIIYGHTGVTGQIPSSIGNLVNLVQLNLFANRLSGPIPSGLSNLTKLTQVYLNGNKFLTGSIPPLANLTVIANLWLHDNQLTGSIPSGLSNTLRSFNVSLNNLSGPIPSNVASIPLTAFNISNNNFVFGDMEPGFNNYCSGNRVGFVYSPQYNVDSVRTVNFSTGEALTITPSVAANANDIYQWYKNGVIIPGATSRIFSKTAQDNDSGVYSYRITNSVITGVTIQSNNITLNIFPNPPNQESIYYVTSGSSTWVRGRISENKDIAQQYLWASTNNQEFDFGATYIINSSTVNTISAYQTGILANGSAGDDTAPINTGNIGYILEGHGINIPVVTSVGHDKTSADIGSTWSNGTNQFILAEISGNTLTFYPIAIGAPWVFPAVGAGPLTHVIGATHTNNIVVSSLTSVQKYPAIKNFVKQVLVNGTTQAIDGEGAYADYIDFVEEFDLVDPSTINRTNNPWLWNDGSVWMHVRNVYHATAGNTTIRTTFNVVRPMSIGYFGIIQAGFPAITPYNHAYVYIPKTKPINGYNFKNIQLFDSAPASQISFTSAYVDNINNPPDRQVILKKRNVEDNYDIGFVLGYGPYGDTAANGRNCTSYGAGCWWIYTSQKAYPVMVGGIGVVNNITYDAYAYRQYIDPKQYDIGKLAYWNNQNGHDLVYVDYHRSAVNDITVLPDRFIGKVVSVIESENISAPASVTDQGLVLSTTGTSTYAYAVLELSNDTSSPIISLESPANGATVLGSSVTLTATSTDNVTVSGVQFLVDDINYGTEITSAPYSSNWDTTQYSNGAHSISAIARDAQGNRATTTISVTVNNISPVISDVLATSTTATSTSISWTTSRDTDAQIEYGVNDSYGYYSVKNDTPSSSHSIILGGLLGCTTYHYRVLSSDILTPTATSSDHVFTTLGCTNFSNILDQSSSQVTPSGGTITLENETVNISVEIPADFYSTSTQFQIKQLASGDFLQGVSLPTDYYLAGAHVYNLEALIGATTTLSEFSHNLRVTINYSSQDISSLDGASLMIYRYDAGIWTPLSNCQTSTSSISCETSNFSDFVLLGKQPAVVTTTTSSALPPEAYALPKPPTNSYFHLLINNGDKETSNRQVSLNLFSGIDTVTMAISEDPNFKDASLEPFSALKKYTLSNSFGGKIVYVKFYTRWGRSTVPVSATILLISPTPSPIIDNPATEVKPIKKVTFPKDLKIGSISNEVKLLQISLNKLGFIVAANNRPGAKGKETRFYGPATVKALKALQLKYNFKPANGLLSGKTREKLNSLLSGK